ncbi:MAG: gamma-glutamylcyclotransferase family protein [Gammaproteobacteria bacterium]|nr:gamma-glutamylcyclotransferase family protein [Gammaproteobacteria bacterium]
MIVAVYGTLKRGMTNHQLLVDCRFVGEDCLANIVLYELDEFPAARLEPSDGIQVEVYEVSQRVLAMLDKLEEVDHAMPEKGLYRRAQCATRFGVAWIYLYNGTVQGFPRLTTGGWRPI